MNSIERLRHRELERLAARLEKVAEAASLDLRAVFLSPRRSRRAAPRAKGAGRGRSSRSDAPAEPGEVRTPKGGA